MFSFNNKSKTLFLIANILLIFSLLCCLSCEKRKHSNPLDPDYESGFPNISDMNYAMWLTLWSEGMIECPFKVNSSKLKLNGEEISLDWDYYEEDELSSCEFYFWKADGGEEISYELTINGKKFTGKIKMVHQIHGDFPAEFDSTKDFTFKWTIQESPQIQDCVLSMGKYGEDEEKHEEWEIGASERKFIISKNNYLADWDWVDITIDCNNFIYNKNDKFLITSFSLDYVWYNNSGKGNYIRNNKTQQALREQRLKSLLKFR